MQVVLLFLMLSGISSSYITAAQAPTVLDGQEDNGFLDDSVGDGLRKSQDPLQSEQSQEALQQNNVSVSNDSVVKQEKDATSSPVPKNDTNDESKKESDQKATNVKEQEDKKSVAVQQGPRQDKSAPLEQPEKEAFGINTLNLKDPSGNWLYKRLWYEKAEQRYDMIKTTMGRINETRVPFYTRRTQADREIFEPLFLSVGLSQGELSVILEYLMKQVSVLTQKESGSLGLEERAFLGLIVEQQKSLEQLNLDVQAIAKVENALDDALNQLLDQINVAQGYEKEAWQHFRTIAKELSDKVARGHYYHIETLQKNVDDILQWITQDFSDYIDQLFKTASDQAERIKQVTQSLKEKGIDFKKHAEQLEAEAQQREQATQKLEKQQLIKDVEAKAREEMSWLGQLKYLGTTVTGGISSAWNYVTSSVCCAYQAIKGVFISATVENVETKPSQNKPAEEQKPLPTIPKVPQPHEVQEPSE